MSERSKENDFTPSPYVLRRYAKDMETNTRLIDGDIAPYLRKVAQWIEEQRIPDAEIDCLKRQVELLRDGVLNSIKCCKSGLSPLEGLCSTFAAAEQIGKE